MSVENVARVSFVTLINFGLGLNESKRENFRLSTLMQLLFSFDQDTRVDETLMQTLACQLSCNSCSRLTKDTRVDETLMPTLACQLSCNSCSRLTRSRELMKLSCKLSLVNSHATLVLV